MSVADRIRMDGLRVIVHPWLPEEPTLQQDIVRMVRHGLADILEALGEDVGPAPGEPIHAYIHAGALFVSRELYDQIRAEAATEPWPT